MATAVSEAADVKGTGKGKRKGEGRAYMIEMSRQAVRCPATDLGGVGLSWYCINDVIMGGQSSANCSVDEEGRMMFQGIVSTVGGGFASCRTTEAPLGIGESDVGIRITYTSDGRLYKLKIGTGSSSDKGAPAGRGDIQWVCPLPLLAGHHSAVLLFSQFHGKLYGNVVPDAVFDGASMQFLGFNVGIFDVDGNAIEGESGGPFSFMLERLELVQAQYDAEGKL